MFVTYSKFFILRDPFPPPISHLGNEKIKPWIRLSQNFKFKKELQKRKNCFSDAAVLNVSCNLRLTPRTTATISHPYKSCADWANFFSTNILGSF